MYDTPPKANHPIDFFTCVADREVTVTSQSGHQQVDNIEIYNTKVKIT